MNWIADLTKWIFDLVVKFVAAIWNFVVDVIIELADLLLTVVAEAIKAIPVPDFVTDYKLGTLIGQIDGDILFFVGILQIPLGLSFLAAGFGVRMLRKAVTLFQW